MRALPAGAGVEPEAAASGTGTGTGTGTGSALDRAEREQIVQAMQTARQNVSLAARMLGISRDTLRYRLEKHGLRH
jgi:DNA-binding NtrC family response regulator